VLHVDLDDGPETREMPVLQPCRPQNGSHRLGKQCTLLVSIGVLRVALDLKASLVGETRIASPVLDSIDSPD
jgi:hypothetical protein